MGPTVRSGSSSSGATASGEDGCASAFSLSQPFVFFSRTKSAPSITSSHVRSVHFPPPLKPQVPKTRREKWGAYGVKGAPGKIKVAESGHPVFGEPDSLVLEEISFCFFSPPVPCLHVVGGGWDDVSARSKHHRCFCCSVSLSEKGHSMSIVLYVKDMIGVYDKTS